MVTVELSKASVISSQEISLTNYQTYRSEGGILNSESYGMLESFTGLKNRSLRVSTFNIPRSQGISMATFAKIELVEEEIGMYVLLRTLPPSKESTSEELTLNPEQLSDQVLLAEILRFTKSTQREEFIKKYPNIFSPVGQVHD